MHRACERRLPWLLGVVRPPGQGAVDLARDQCVVLFVSFFIFWFRAVLTQGRSRRPS
jgi:hypothetical protein